MKQSSAISTIEMPSQPSIMIAESCTFFQAQYQAMATQTANSRIGGAVIPIMASSEPENTVKPVTPAMLMPR